MNIIDLENVKGFLNEYDYDKAHRDILKAEDDINKVLIKLSKDYDIEITHVSLRPIKEFSSSIPVNYGVRLSFIL